MVLDGVPLNITQPDLGEALRAAAALAERNGRIIVDVIADGQALDEKALARAERSKAEVQELRLASADPRELVRTSLLDAEDALEQARTDQCIAAEMIHGGQVDEARESLASMLKTWQAVRDVLARGSAVLRVDLDRVDLAKASAGAVGGRVSDQTHQLFAQLDDLKSALAREDWSAVADTLGADMDDLVESWQAMLRTLADYVGSLPGGMRPGGGAA